MFDLFKLFTVIQFSFGSMEKNCFIHFAGIPHPQQPDSPFNQTFGNMINGCIARGRYQYFFTCFYKLSYGFHQCGCFTGAGRAMYYRQLFILNDSCNGLLLAVVALGV